MNRLDILLIISIIAGLSCLGTVGSMITSGDHYRKGYWIVAGNSAHVFLFITSCIASTVCILIVGTKDEATKTRFFTSFNGLMAIFYIASSIAAIIYSTDGESISAKDLKQPGIAGAVIGMVASLLHGLASFLSRF